MSCKDDLGNNNLAMVDNNLGISVTVTDSSGKDLLDSTQTGSIDISKIKRFYLDENGE